MQSHDRKLDNFLTLLILNIQVQKRKEKLSLSTVTEWSNALFKFKWKQIYIFLAAISLKRSSFKLASSILHFGDSGAVGNITYDVMETENDQC